MFAIEFQSVAQLFGTIANIVQAGHTDAESRLRTDDKLLYSAIKSSFVFSQLPTKDIAPHTIHFVHSEHISHWPRYLTHAYHHSEFTESQDTASNRYDLFKGELLAHTKASKGWAFTESASNAIKWRTQKSTKTLCTHINTDFDRMPTKTEWNVSECKLGIEKMGFESETGSSDLSNESNTETNKKSKKHKKHSSKKRKNRRKKRKRPLHDESESIAVEESEDSDISELSVVRRSASASVTVSNKPSMSIIDIDFMRTYICDSMQGWAAAIDSLNREQIKTLFGLLANDRKDDGFEYVGHIFSKRELYKQNIIKNLENIGAGVYIKGCCGGVWEEYEKWKDNKPVSVKKIKLDFNGIIASQMKLFTK